MKRYVLGTAFLLLLAVSGPASAGIQYYVDPVNGVDAADRGTLPDRAWKTVDFAVQRILALAPASRAGLELNLRANALYPPLGLPRTLIGDPAQPIVIQPYDGDRVVFDGGEPRFRQPGAWEPVPGQADEWRTKDTFTLPPAGTPFKVAWGQMMDTRYRLITYHRLEDFRATSESELAPFAYLGPGLFYVYENPEQTVGRTHLRLSSTHLGALGITDYVGGGDPNTMNLSIARTTGKAGYVAAQNLVFKKLTFQNGGLSTLQIEFASNLTFDHCEVYGGRYGVVIAGNATGLKFHHCTFDGGLAPWTTRYDVKDGPGSETHDILVIHGAGQSEYVNCTFRHAHDGLQFTGDQVEVRDSLFEDINDETLQLNGRVTNARLHGNVIRQALNAVSFHANPTGGPVYFYRNVVDQRVPTRGYRILPPDAPAPFIWRYGSDIKDVPTVEFHSYQNTFIASNALDKSSYVSHLFYTDPPGLTTSRNNLYLVLNTDVTMGHVPSSTNPAVADGNIWYRYHPNPDPLFRTPLFLSVLGKYFTLDELHADLPDWETHSQIAEPQLANFTDEYFDYASFYPNTDFRPLPASPAAGGGVLLPASLPDDFGPALGAPDVGARPISAPVLAVGVDAATLFPVPGVPVACAGPDQSVVDADGDGFEAVRLDGSASHDPDGSLTAYAWSIKGRRVAATAAATLNLPEGDHYVRLLVGDNAGNVDSDAVRVRVAPLVPGDNLLVCAGFEDRPCGWKGSSANVGLTSAAADVHSGSWALRILQDSAPQTVRQRVAITPGSTYTVSGWVKTKAGSPATRPTTLTANVLDAGGTVLKSIVFANKQGNSPYSYHQTGPITAGPTAAFLEVVGTLEGATFGTDTALFDDLRIRDRNLLQNGRFETASPSGSTIEAPGWAFGKGGRIVNDAALARSGRYALALEPSPEYHHITQLVVHTPGRGYRLSAWLKTLGLGTAPVYSVRFLNASRGGLGSKVLPASTSEGVYSPVSGVVAAAEIPAGTAFLEITIHLDHVSAGSAYFDDVLVEPLT